MLPLLFLLFGKEKVTPKLTPVRSVLPPSGLCCAAFVVAGSIHFPLSHMLRAHWDFLFELIFVHFGGLIRMALM
jgi:hypothetical protein